MKKGCVVTLTYNELYVASFVGLRRRLSSLKGNFKEQNGVERKSLAERWFYNIVGAQGEVAFAKGTGLFWPATVNVQKHEPDVLPDWQIRTAEGADFCLIIRVDDRDSQKHALMTGNGPDFVFRGWIWGEHAKRPEWWKDKGNRNKHCWWVPQSALMDDTEKE